MSRQHNPLQQYQEAWQFARDYNLFIVEKAGQKGTRYLVYRKCGGRNVLIGQRGSVQGLRSFIEKAAISK